MKIKDICIKKVVRITLGRSLLFIENSYKLVTTPPPIFALFEKDLNHFLYYRLSFNVMKNIKFDTRIINSNNLFDFYIANSVQPFRKSAILKNDRHLEFSRGYRVFLKGYILDNIHAKFGACITK